MSGTTLVAPADPQRALWEEYARTRCVILRGRLEAQYLHLVETLARQLSKKLPESVDVHDLIQEGFLGLRRAVERFELRRAVKFSTYAQSAIWGAMMDSLRRDDAGSRGERREATRLSEHRSLLGHELGRPPSDEEVADRMGVTWEKLSTIARWTEATNVAAVAGRGSNGGGDDRRLQWPADESAADPALEAQWRDMRELLLKGFNSMERLLIILYYFEELTMREIGMTLGISESRVSQMHSLLVDRIKSEMMRKRIAWE